MPITVKVVEPIFLVSPTARLSRREPNASPCIDRDRRGVANASPLTDCVRRRAATAFGLAPPALGTVRGVCCGEPLLPQSCASAAQASAS